MDRNKGPKDPRDLLEIKSRAIRRKTSMFDEYNKYLPTWKRLRKFIDPLRGEFARDGQQPNDGQRNDEELLDGEASLANTICANAMHSGLTSPAMDWFRYSLHDPELAEFSPVRTYLNKIKTINMAIAFKSSAYKAFHHNYNELPAFGTACSLVFENYQNVLRNQWLTIGEYALGVGADGRVNAITREYWQTVWQVVEEFGYRNCPKSIQDAYDQSRYDQWIKVNWLCYPNGAADPRRGMGRDMPFISLYWADGMGDKEFLRMSGFHEFPALAPRWMVVGSGVYGKGPGWRALAESMMLQKLQEDSLVGLDKVIDPPMQGPASLLAQGGINIRPGAANYHNDNSQNGGVRPAVQINPDLASIEAKIQAVARKVNRYFFTDVWLMLSANSALGKDGTKTATEILELHQEKLLLLGPVLESVYDDMLNPFHDRLIGIGLRAGIYPDPPKEIQGQELRVEYVSALAQAQKMAVIASMRQTLGFAGEIAAVQPQIMDVLDTDKMLRIFSDVSGSPPDTLRAEEVVAQIRKANAQAAARIEQANNSMALANGAKILSQADMSGDNALSRMAAAGGTPSMEGFMSA